MFFKSFPLRIWRETIKVVSLPTETTADKRHPLSPASGYPGMPFRLFYVPFGEGCTKFWSVTTIEPCRLSMQELRTHGAHRQAVVAVQVVVPAPAFGI